MKEFVHLHLHTEYSLLDGATRINSIFSTCDRLNMPAAAITDHGNMYGVMDFYNAANSYKAKQRDKIKPILGCEFYTAPDMHSKSDKTANHLVLLAKDYQGYKNLIKLDSAAFVEGFYYKPKIDLELLRKHSEGLICLSGCLSGVIPRYLKNGERNKALEYAGQLSEIFGKENFYIELQDHLLEDQRLIMNDLISLAEMAGVKTVATNDVHYLTKDDYKMHEVLLCIQTGKKFSDTDRMRFETNEFYLKSYDEMYKLFSWNEQALKTTLEISEKCNVKLPGKQKLIPDFDPGDFDNKYKGMAPADFLRLICYEGLKERYGTITDAIQERAEYELKTIIDMGFAEYYLIVWDFIRYSRDHGIPVGPGRGSGVGSIVAYAIHITNVEPLHLDLLFERFLNPERVSNPDFDVDFCYVNRYKVIDYVVDKYKKENVSQIVTFGTLAPKAAVKDVARVYNMSFDDSNALTKLIPNGKVNLKEALGDKLKGNENYYENFEKAEDAQKAKENFVPDLAEKYCNDKAAQEVIDMAVKLEGMPRNTSMHAAGVVICRDPIDEHVPLQVKDGVVTTQYNKDLVEELGLLKMDFLGLITLTDIEEAINLIEKKTGKRIDFDSMDSDDKQVYDLISTGDTDAVFQLEGGGMKNFMKKLKPSCMEDIIAGISLYRPGPMSYIDQYVENKYNPQKIVYADERLRSILTPTYGIIVYQEQVMSIVRELAGYSLGGADIMRRIISKKKLDKIEKERITFLHGAPAKEAVFDEKGEVKTPAVAAVPGALKMGVDEKVANKIYDDIAAFASYAFNKSHAAAYAVLSYRTAWLKRYYPVELYTAVINDRIGKPEVPHYITCLKAMGTTILLPNVNESGVLFTIEEEGVRIGLSQVKNAGEGAMGEIVSEREQNGKFKTFDDFISRCAHILNKRMVESLIKAGAFDCFGYTRATLMSNYETIFTAAVKEKKAKSSGQMTFMDFLGEKEETQMDLVAEYPEKNKLEQEKAMLSVYVSGHPLESYLTKRNELNFFTSELLQEEPEEFTEEEESQQTVSVEKFNKQKVVMGGMLTACSKKLSKSGNYFCVGILEDLDGEIEFMAFNKVFERSKELFEEGNIVKVSGTLDKRAGNESYSLLINNIGLWDDGQTSQSTESGVGQNSPQTQKTLYLKAEKDLNITINNIRAIIKDYPGNVPVRIQFEKKLYDLNAFVEADSEMLERLEKYLGSENIKLK